MRRSMPSKRASRPAKRISSPENRVSSAPRRVSMPEKRCCSSRISAVSPKSRPPTNSSVTVSSLMASSPDAAFEADGEEFLRFDRELHRQLLQDVAAEPVDDQRQRILVGE